MSLPLVLQCLSSLKNYQCETLKIAVFVNFPYYIQNYKIQYNSLHSLKKTYQNNRTLISSLVNIKFILEKRSIKSNLPFLNLLVSCNFPRKILYNAHHKRTNIGNSSKFTISFLFHEVNMKSLAD